MTLFNMIKRSKPRSAVGKTKNIYGNPTDFKPKNTNVKQNLDKYMNLAREALTVGDRIAAEGYYQQAEHCLRSINDYKAKQPAAILPLTGNNSEEEALNIMPPLLHTPELAGELPDFC